MAGVPGKPGSVTTRYIDGFFYSGEYMKIWWIAKDVCDVLGVGNVSESLKNIDDNEKSTISNIESRNGGGNEI